LLQVFLRTFPDPSLGRWPVSGPGGNYPRWRRDGRELFFVDSQGWLSAVSVSGGLTAQVGEPSRLFQLPGYTDRTQSSPYDVSPDGQRFVVQRRRGALRPIALTVAINWMASLDAAPVP
jgi:eukaryotic-like serine/threonine-protein kinase